jgi:hypothetical protein
LCQFRCLSASHSQSIVGNLIRQERGVRARWILRIIFVLGQPFATD